jgi:general stress protein 26
MIDHMHYKRVRSELKDAGMTKYGFFKLATDHLPELIHENEHIKGVIYGRLQGKMDSVMLVATDKRILFVDYKPFYKNADEITYEVVSGVNLTVIGLHAGVVLHTRVKDYALRFVNIECAEKFTHYIEGHIETGIKRASKSTKNPETEKKYQPYKLPVKEPEIIETNIVLDTDTAVLSTLGKDNEVHASVVHYITDKNENFYILTKTETTKSQNITRNSYVALTIHSSGSLRSLLIKGPAVVETDQDISSSVYNQITSPKEYTEGKKLPPITQLEKGSYVVYKIVPSSSVLQDFSTSDW